MNQPSAPVASTTNGPATSKAAVPIRSCTMQLDVDFRGNDIDDGTRSVPDVDACATMCLEVPSCTHFTFRGDKDRCYLKTSGDGRRSKSGAVGGVCMNQFVPSRHRRAKTSAGLESGPEKEGSRAAFFTALPFGLLIVAFALSYNARVRMQRQSERSFGIQEPTEPRADIATVSRQRSRSQLKV